MRSFQYKNQVNGEVFFAYLCVILLYFSLEFRLIPAVLQLGQVRLFWKLIRSRIWQLSHNCILGQEFDSCHITVKPEFESIFQAVEH